MKIGYDAMFAETITQTIADLLETELRDTPFRVFYDGDPVEIPKSSLPGVIVQYDRLEVRHGATGMDKLRHFMTIKLVIDKRNEIGKDHREVMGQNTLMNYAAGIDSETGEYDEKSVMGVLRKKFTLENVILNQEGDVDLDIFARGERMITAEAHLRLIADQNKIVSNRT